MEVVFTDSFFTSFKRMINREKWYWKCWEFFRYKLPGFISNIWKFRKELYRHRGWDSGYSMEMLSRSLEILADTIEKYGNEIDGPRLKKVEAMRRAVEILTNIGEDCYIEMAEAYLDKEIDYSSLFYRDESPEVTKSNSEIYDLANKLEKTEWTELFEILQGQDHEQYRVLYEASSDEEKSELWNKWFNGTGMKHWWT